jgi:hypothetical protein
MPAKILEEAAQPVWRRINLDRFNQIQAAFARGSIADITAVWDDHPAEVTALRYDVIARAVADFVWERDAIRRRLQDNGSDAIIGGHHTRIKAVKRQLAELPEVSIGLLDEIEQQMKDLAKEVKRVKCGRYQLAAS